MNARWLAGASGASRQNTGANWTSGSSLHKNPNYPVDIVGRSNRCGHLWTLSEATTERTHLAAIRAVRTASYRQGRTFKSVRPTQGKPFGTSEHAESCRDLPMREPSRCWIKRSMAWR